ncbi:L,D-transpeptidase [Pseudonocardia phyllosphaerae]|uniref:L,D-transpeptidase n=1 Tax=Pseudonocardia phyllosphaerae TaxID=3390502 RepID=UPI00397C8511
MSSSSTSRRPATLVAAVLIPIILVCGLITAGVASGSSTPTSAPMVRGALPGVAVAQSRIPAMTVSGDGVDPSAADYTAAASRAVTREVARAEAERKAEEARKKAEEARRAAAKKASAAPCEPTVKACVSLSRGKAWITDGAGTTVFGPFSVLGGRSDEPTPVGTFSVSMKDANYHSREFDAPMPNSVFFFPGVAFHQGSLSRASAGCLHLSRGASATVFSMLNPGDSVQVLP